MNDSPLGSPRGALPRLSLPSSLPLPRDERASKNVFVTGGPSSDAELRSSSSYESISEDKYPIPSPTKQPREAERALGLVAGDSVPLAFRPRWNEVEDKDAFTKDAMANSVVSTSTHSGGATAHDPEHGDGMLRLDNAGLRAYNAIHGGAAESPLKDWIQHVARSADAYKDTNSTTTSNGTIKPYNAEEREGRAGRAKSEPLAKDCSQLVRSIEETSREFWDANPLSDRENNGDDEDEDDEVATYYKIPLPDCSHLDVHRHGEQTSSLVGIVDEEQLKESMKAAKRASQVVDYEIDDEDEKERILEQRRLLAENLPSTDAHNETIKSRKPSVEGRSHLSDYLFSTVSSRTFRLLAEGAGASRAMRGQNGSDAGGPMNETAASTLASSRTPSLLKELHAEYEQQCLAANEAERRAQLSHDEKLNLEHELTRQGDRKQHRKGGSKDRSKEAESKGTESKETEDKETKPEKINSRKTEPKDIKPRRGRSNAEMHTRQGSRQVQSEGGPIRQAHKQKGQQQLAENCDDKGDKDHDCHKQCQHPNHEAYDEFTYPPYYVQPAPMSTADAYRTHAPYEPQFDAHTGRPISPRYVVSETTSMLRTPPGVDLHLGGWVNYPPPRFALMAPKMMARIKRSMYGGRTYDADSDSDLDTATVTSTEAMQLLDDASVPPVLAFGIPVARAPAVVSRWRESAATYTAAETALSEENTATRLHLVRQRALLDRLRASAARLRAQMTTRTLRRLDRDVREAAYDAHEAMTAYDVARFDQLELQSEAAMVESMLMQQCMGFGVETVDEAVEIAQQAGVWRTDEEVERPVVSISQHGAE